MTFKNHFKSIFLYFACVFFVFCLLGYTVKTIPVVSFKGEGTEENPYQIATKEDLFTLAALVNDDVTTSIYGLAYYIQTADIDLENELFEPIGTYSDYSEHNLVFAGVYNGNGHKITNLNINYNGVYCGLFGRMGKYDYVNSNNLVTNLSVYGNVVCTLNDYSLVGGIVGEIGYGATVTNCYFNGTVSGKFNAGGIAGCIWCGNGIESCYANADITADVENAGGICGKVDVGCNNLSGSTDAYIKNCYFIGNVTAEKNAAAICGKSTIYTERENSKINISNCYYLKDECAVGSNGEATECETDGITPNIMKKIADDLGEPFVTNTNPDLNNGYPVFEWQLNPVDDEPEILFGDVNNDSEINLKDVVLIRRYIVGGWNVEINESAADVNHDGEINLKDVVLIRRYIVGGWDVEFN